MCRNMELPERLAHKLALFRANARIVREHEELFTETGWMQVMIGQGIMPEHWHPLADAPTGEQLAEFLELTRAHAAHVAGAMPDHAAYIAANCAAPGIGVAA
jgi:tryptophan halogenase